MVKSLKPMLTFLLLFILFLLVPDFYIWRTFIRLRTPRLWQWLYWLPTLITWAAIIGWAVGGHAEWMLRLFSILLLCLALPKLLFALCVLIGRGVGLAFPSAVRIGKTAGVIAALISCGIGVYGFTLGWKQLRVVETSLTLPDLPAAFDGYRIVQISDLHIGTYGQDTTFVHRLIQQVRTLHPDLIVFTGDLVNSAPEELDGYQPLLSTLHAPDGVLSVLGNHDYCTYRRYDTPNGADQKLEELKERERAMGWDLMLNENRIIRRGTDSMVILGMENCSRPPFPSHGSLPDATRGISPDAFQILLTHDPSVWRREIVGSTPIRLMLAGHTHAMQFKIGRFTPIQWSYPEWGGLYREGNQYLYISLGAGGTVPFRFGAWPEINLITLHKSTAPHSGQ